LKIVAVQLMARGIPSLDSSPQAPAHTTRRVLHEIEVAETKLQMGKCIHLQSRIRKALAEVNERAVSNCAEKPDDDAEAIRGLEVRADCRLTLQGFRVLADPA